MKVKFLKNTKTGAIVMATEALLKHGGRHLVPYDPDAGGETQGVDPAVISYRKRIKELEGEVEELNARIVAMTERLEAKGDEKRDVVKKAKKAESEKKDKAAAEAKDAEKTDVPDFNRVTLISEAIASLTPDQFDAQGLPSADALEPLVGDTTSEERQSAMEMFKELKE